MKAPILLFSAMLLCCGPLAADPAPTNLGGASAVAGQANSGVLAAETARRSLLIGAAVAVGFAVAVGAVNRDEDATPAPPAPPPPTPPSH